MSNSSSSKWLRYLKNKYVITLFVFLIIIFVLSDNNVFLIWRLQRDVNQLHKSELVIKEEIVADSIEAERLQTDLEAIERYGRENYYMKRADEDIYVINPETDK